MRPLRLVPLLLALCSACGDDEPVPAGQTPPPPDTTGVVTTTGITSADSTTGEPSRCACEPGRFCAAPYEPGAPEPEEFACLDECVPPGAPGFWCGNDASCCRGVCRPGDGLCGSPVAETDDGTTGTTGTTGTSEGPTGTTTGEASTTEGTTTGDATTGSSGGTSSTG